MARVLTRIAISTSTFGVHGGDSLERLERAGCHVRLNPHGRKLTEGEAIDLLEGAAGLIAGVEPLTRRVLEASSELRVISRCGVGLDNVDLAATEELGVQVFSTPEAHVDAVAELTLAGLLALLRQITVSDRALREGRWMRPMGRLLKGRTVGLVGLGRTGKAFAQLLGPFGVRLLAADPQPDEAFAESTGIRLTDLDPLLAESDIVSLHLPYSSAVHHLIDASRLARIKPGAYLVNCARGGLVDERALVEQLRSGRIAGAYLDVFETEPYDGVLTTEANVVLTSHIGSYAAESRVLMESEATSNLLHALGPG